MPYISLKTAPPKGNVIKIRKCHLDWSEAERRDPSPSNLELRISPLAALGRNDTNLMTLHLKGPFLFADVDIVFVVMNVDVVEDVVVAVAVDVVVVGIVCNTSDPYVSSCAADQAALRELHSKTQTAKFLFIAPLAQ